MAVWSFAQGDDISRKQPVEITRKLRHDPEYLPLPNTIASILNWIVECRRLIEKDMI
jgi:hypothetical protein